MIEHCETLRADTLTNEQASEDLSVSHCSCATPYLSCLGLCGSIKADIGMRMQVQEGLQDVQHPRHLGEDQRLMTASLQTS